VTAYTNVRGLARGLQVLRALNAMEGGRATSQQIADLTGLHRTIRASRRSRSARRGCPSNASDRRKSPSNDDGEKKDLQFSDQLSCILRRLRRAFECLDPSLQGLLPRSSYTDRSNIESDLTGRKRCCCTVRPT
jgi:hypothetical protein